MHSTLTANDFISLLCAFFFQKSVSEEHDQKVFVPGSIAKLRQKRFDHCLGFSYTITLNCDCSTRTDLKKVLAENYRPKQTERAKNY